MIIFQPQYSVQPNEMLKKLFKFSLSKPAHPNLYIHLFQIRLSPSKAEKSNTSAKSLLGVKIKNTQTDTQNLVSRDT